MTNFTSLHQPAGYAQMADKMIVRYSHPAQRLHPTRDPDVVWCYDWKAGLRWRVTPHPLHGRSWVLQPATGHLRVGQGVYRGHLLVHPPKHAPIDHTVQVQY